MTDFLRCDLGAIAGLLIWCGFAVAIHHAVRMTAKDRDPYDVNRNLQFTSGMFSLGAVLLIAAIALIPLALLLN